MLNNTSRMLRRFLLTVPLLAGLGGGLVSATTVPVDDHGHDHDGGALRRLVVASGEAELLLIDLDETGARHVVGLGSPAGLATSVTESGRFVLVGHADGVTVVDGGVWSEPHGDHSHDHVEDPAVVGVIPGERPTHLISHGGTAALWFDGTGEALLFDEAALAAGDVGSPDHHHAASGPHHGFAIPLDDVVVSTEMGEDDAEMPGTVVIVDADETVLAELECSDTHGEAVWSGGVAAACADGVLVVTEGADGWNGTLVEYPEVDDSDPYGYGDARAWTLTPSPDGSTLAAALGANHVLIVDPAAASASAVELAAPTAMFGVVFADDVLLVLDGSGALNQIDPAAAAIVGSIADVVAPFTDGADGRYVFVVVAGDAAYVADTVAPAIAVVDLAAGAVGEPLALDAVPTALAVVGTA